MSDTMKQLPKTPMLPSSINDIREIDGLLKALWDHVIKNNQLDNEQIKRIQALEARVKELEDLHP